MRMKGRDGLMEPDEAEKLLRVGFSWMENRDSWHESFDEAACEIANCRRYNTWTLSSDTENWLKVQFMLLEYDLLPTRRKERLESLRLEWDGKEFGRKGGHAVSDVGAENGLVYDEEISTGSDLKDAARLWTPDRNGPAVVAADDRPSSEEQGDSDGLPAVAMHSVETPEKIKAGSKEETSPDQASTVKAPQQDTNDKPEDNSAESDGMGDSANKKDGSMKRSEVADGEVGQEPQQKKSKTAKEKVDSN